jgi:PAS domain S-box-containing protein
MEKEDTQRVKAVDRFINLKNNKKKELQDIVELAAQLCKAPIALISLVDKDVLFHKFKVGVEVEENLLKESFCQYIIEKDEMLVVPDTVLDIRFSEFPFVVGEPKIRFYAGAPLITYDGLAIGTLCVFDVKPRKLTKAQKHLLNVLARRVIEIVEFEYLVFVLKKQIAEAKEAEIKIRSYFDSPGACHLLVGTNMEILAFNRNMAVFAKNVHGINIKTGDNLDNLIKDEDLNWFIEKYNKAVLGNSITYEKKYHYKNGEITWMQLNFAPSLDTHGKIMGVSFDAIDITDRKLKEQQLMDKTACLDEIAIIQSHELRRPVASILGLVELFKLSGYRSNKKNLKLMEKAATELDNTIRKIIHYTE